MPLTFRRLSAGLAAACSIATGALAGDGEAARIKLTFDGKGGVAARFSVAEPTSALRFERTPDASRAADWRLDDPEFEIVQKDSADLLRRKDGAPFRAVAASMAVKYRSLPKDYAPFSPFTDGGLLFHTGRFHACAGEAGCAGSALSWRFEIAAPTNARIIAYGRAHLRHARVNSSASGTNVYIGKARPVATNDAIAVIDPGFPEAARAPLERLLPPLMRLFSERFGALKEKPALFASLDPDPPPGSDYSSQGGVLPGQVFIHLYGERWRGAADARAAGFLPWFFAHEIAHLYQLKDVSGAFDGEEAWIHEGGADALAAAALETLGAAAPEYIADRIDSAERQCAKGLAELGAPLLEASARGAFQNHYSCGLILHRALAVSAGGGASGAYAVWTEYLARTRDGAPWSGETFFAAAQAAGAGEAALDFARRLVAEKHDDPAAYLAAHRALWREAAL